MRTIDTHKVNGCNEALSITVLDGPGPGGACHHYCIEGFKEPIALTPDEVAAGCGDESADEVTLKFQNGPIKEVGTNGVTHEALLAVVEDRLRCFQAGPYACDENAVALMHVQAAMTALKNRTAARQARGVEGTHTV